VLPAARISAGACRWLPVEPWRRPYCFNRGPARQRPGCKCRL